MLPDYSEYLTEEKFLIEEQAWIDAQAKDMHKNYVKGITWAQADRWARGNTSRMSVIEFGCGTGWVASLLPKTMEYRGVDKNVRCLEAARRLCPDRTFVEYDIRDFHPNLMQMRSLYSVSCAFAFLKHFGLHEWKIIAQILFQLGEYAVFTMSIASTDVDDGTEFHHVWVSEDTLGETAREVGKTVLFHRVLHPLPQNREESLFVVGP